MHKRTWRRKVMSSVSHRFLAVALAAGAMTAMGVVATPAWAQDTAAGQEEIIVTGSRIRTDPLTNRQPVTELGTEDIAKTGLSSVADVLQRLPVSGGGLNTRNNNSGNIGSPPDGGGVGAGAAEIDLRFLSGRRVLVLVDGLRWVNGTAGSGIPGSVDLNTIPSAMIDRIEVLQESASPIYGSDAIAGVVNVITRRHQDGFEGYAQVGEYFEQGDGLTQDYQFSYGADLSPNTDVVFGASYQDQELISSGDRELSAFPAPYASSCAPGGCSIGIPNGFFDINDPNTGEDLAIIAATNGAPPLYDPLNPHAESGTNSFRDFTGAPDRFNFAPFNYIQTPSERFGGFASLSHEFSSTLALRVRASYANRRSANQAAPLPLFLGPDAGTGTIADDTVIDVTNPYNPFGFTLTPGGTYDFIGRRLVEAGPRHFEQQVDTWNVLGSLEGQWNLFGRDWFWDFNAEAGGNEAKQSFTGNLNVANVQQALGPVALCTGACVPLNIFGGAGAITSDMLNFIGYTERNSSESEMQDYTFNITGDLMDLPAGPLSVAAGIEHRHTEGSFTPDPITAAGLSSDIPALPSSGEFDVDEVYGELRVPLLANAPLAYMLEASVAGRYFDYSTFGADSTFEAGLRWRPVEQLLLRASWGQGFRAPAIGELFGSASRFDLTVTDPCNDLLTLPGNVQTNCINNGVPADGSYSQLNPQLPVFTTGNEDLQPETSESYNIGAVWAPTFVENTSWADALTFEVNYANIQLDNAIQSTDSQAVMVQCATTGDPAACATITRSGTGAVRGITNPLINIGGIEVRAVDYTVAWVSPDWSIGQFSVRASASNLLEFTETNSGGSISREGTERGSPTASWPEWKATTTIDWELNSFGATLINRYVSDVTEVNNGGTEMDSFSAWDLQARWTPGNFDDRVMFTLGVNNIFDEDTPGCFSCDVNNMDPSIHDVPGRFGFVRVSFRQ